MKIGVIINFCSNEERFLSACLESLVGISSHTVVSVSDHFFDGIPEDIVKVKALARKHQSAEFLIYEAQNQYQPRPGIYSRKLAVERLNDDIDWVLSLDVDEILDKVLFKEYIESKMAENYDSISLKNYYYFREPIYRARQTEDSAILARRNIARFDPCNQAYDRQQIHHILDCKKINDQSFNGVPMVHHFSWVRSKNEMLKKVTSWGHKNDRDWVSLVNNEFSREFNFKCFVHGYDYEIVENRFQIPMIEHK